jgi:hypothetical protein
MQRNTQSRETVAAHGKLTKLKKILVARGDGPPLLLIFGDSFQRTNSSVCLLELNDGFHAWGARIRCILGGSIAGMLIGLGVSRILHPSM